MLVAYLQVNSSKIALNLQFYAIQVGILVWFWLHHLEHSTRYAFYYFSYGLAD